MVHIGYGGHVAWPVIWELFILPENVPLSWFEIMKFTSTFEYITVDIENDFLIEFSVLILTGIASRYQFQKCTMHKSTLIGKCLCKREDLKEYNN